MKIEGGMKKYIFYGCVLVSLGVIAYFGMSQHCGTKPATKGQQNESAANLSQANAGNQQDIAVNEKTVQSENNINQESTAKPTQQPTPTAQPAASGSVKSPTAPPANTPQANPAKQTEPVKNVPPTENKIQQPAVANNTQPAAPKEEKAVAPIPQPQIEGLKIPKSEITATAKFYPYKVDNTYMEVMAVKASDGTIRTALNTCQVCFDSGKGYYQQMGEYMVCQNCKNKFHIDQLEKVKGGCNPVPVLAENKKDTGDSIIIPKDFLASQKEFFSNWKKF